MKMVEMTYKADTFEALVDTIIMMPIRTKRKMSTTTRTKQNITTTKVYIII